MKTIKKNHLQNARFVYQNQSPSESSFAKQEKDNLDQVSDTVKESYTKRLELMKDLDNKLSPISEEKKQHEQIIAEMQAEYSALNGRPLQREFECLGEKILITMSSKGYQEYLNGQEINFLQWAIEQKQKSNPTLNA